MFEKFADQKAEQDRQERARAAKYNTWTSFSHPPALTNEQLRCLSDKAQELGRPLTDDEREVLLYGKVRTKFVSGVRVLEV
jgi:tRNA(Leu) C34 or U34 (ribose-2'-O)-methylase TrmL